MSLILSQAFAANSDVGGALLSKELSPPLHPASLMPQWGMPVEVYLPSERAQAPHVGGLNVPSSNNTETWEPMAPLSYPRDEQFYTPYDGIKPNQKPTLELTSLLLGPQVTSDHSSQIYLGHLGFHHKMSHLLENLPVSYRDIPHSCTLTPPTK